MTYRAFVLLLALELEDQHFLSPAVADDGALDGSLAQVGAGDELAFFAEDCAEGQLDFGADFALQLFDPDYIAGGNPIGDAVTAIGLYIAFYYGLTAFSCVWYYRKTLTSSARTLLMQGILPFLGGLIMYAAGIYSLQSDWVASNSLTSWTVPGLRWQIGGIFIIAVVSALVGVLGFIFMRLTAPAFFKKQTLTRGTPTLVPDEG